MKTLSPGRPWWLVGGSLLAAGAALLAQPVLRADVSASLILHSGKIVTLAPGNDIGEAIAIRDGRVLKVGKTALYSALSSSRASPST